MPGGGPMPPPPGVSRCWMGCCCCCTAAALLCTAGVRAAITDWLMLARPTISHAADHQAARTRCAASTAAAAPISAYHATTGSTNARHLTHPAPVSQAMMPPPMSMPPHPGMPPAAFPPPAQPPPPPGMHPAAQAAAEQQQRQAEEERRRAEQQRQEEARKRKEAEAWTAHKSEDGKVGAGARAGAGHSVCAAGGAVEGLRANALWCAWELVDSNSFGAHCTMTSRTTTCSGVLRQHPAP